MDKKLEYFKKKVLEHLDDMEQKKNAEKKELKKSLIAFEMTSIEKAGYPVGTIREWKGKKYIKIAPNKWRPKYDGESRGAKMSIAALKKKADKCASSQELLQLILENRDRFSDENGRPLPFVKELSDYVSAKNNAIESAKKPKPKITKLSSLTSISDKAWKAADADSGGEIRASAEKSKAFIETVKNELEKKGFELGKDKLSQKVYEKLADRNNHLLNEALGIIGAYGADEQKNALEKNKYWNSERKGNNLDLSLTEFADKDGGIKLTDEEYREIRDKILSNYNYIHNTDEGRQLFLIDIARNNKGKKGETARRYLKEEFGVTAGSVFEDAEDDENNGGGDDGETPDDSGVTKIRKKYESSKSVEGNKKTVTLPDGTKIKCHYKIVEADAPTASHDERTFAPTDGFPTTDDGRSVNDRDYQNDADAQESVRKIAGNFNSLALESPPIVTKDGIVVSGNNRTMSSKLAARNGTDKAYLSDLRDMIDEYGLEEGDLDGFKNPRLVLEVDEEHKGGYTTEEFAQFNRDTKKTMSNVEKAVKLTKTLNADKIQSIAEGLQGYETMGEMYADTKGCQNFVNKLISAGIIGENEKAQYCRSDGTLNDTGKDFCETVLVGSVLNEGNIRKLDRAGGKRIRQKLVRAILPLIENKGNGKEYSFNSELNEAVNIAVTVAQDHEKFPDVKTYLDQGTLFGEKKPDAATERLAELIHDEGEKAFSQRMKDLGAGLRESASGEQDIFLGGVESKESLMSRFLEIKKSVSEMVGNILRKAVTDVLCELVRGDK